jgi:hypothetical protein
VDELRAANVVVGEQQDGPLPNHHVALFVRSLDVLHQDAQFVINLAVSNLL